MFVHQLRAVGLLLVVSSAACFRGPDPFTVDTEDVAVHVILEGGADSVLAMVERPGVPITDAVVRLITGGDTATLAYSPEPCAEFTYGAGHGEGCHRARLDRAIQPGATYALEVLLPDGSRVTGTTVVPLPLVLSSPIEGERVVADCDTETTCYGGYLDEPPYFVPVASVVFRWEGQPDIERLYATVRSRRTFLDGVAYEGNQGCTLGQTLFGSSSVTADSLVRPIPNIACHAEPLRTARFDSIHAEARAYVWNQQFEDYLEALGSSVRARELSVGLEGAWGVFGAITPTSVMLTVLRDPPVPPAARTD